MNGQVNEFQDKIHFQYGVAPSLGKHFLETYKYSAGKKFRFLGMESFSQVEYLNSRFTFFDVPQISDVGAYERLHLLDLNLRGVKSISPKWDLSFYFNPQLSSNLSSGLSSEDFIFGFGFGLSKKWGRSILTVGVERTTALGRPQLLPSIRYGHQINDFTYLQVGFPHTYLAFLIGERHKITVHASAEGYYYNITGNNAFTNFGSVSETKLNFTGLNFSLKHKYKIQPNVTTITQVGLLANNNLQVENSDEVSLLTFNTNETVYFSMGLQFNLNKKRND